MKDPFEKGELPPQQLRERRPLRFPKRNHYADDFDLSTWRNSLKNGFESHERQSSATI